MFAQWVFGKNQQEKVMTGSNNETLSKTFSKAVPDDISTEKRDKRLVNINILNGLSFSGAVEFLLEEGYCEENVVEKEHEECDKLFLHPYMLYDHNKQIVDEIFHAEHCMKDEDSEFKDYKSLRIRQ